MDHGAPQGLLDFAEDSKSTAEAGHLSVGQRARQFPVDVATALGARLISRATALGERQEHPAIGGTGFARDVAT